MDSENKGLKHKALEHLSEKQAEEMDHMLAKRNRLRQTVHSDDKINTMLFSDLFSGLPLSDKKTSSDGNPD